jgi:aspartyl-tRNA(Asn)/glutamyl-tRNA(Gln) amidotransferase subunit A
LLSLTTPCAAWPHDRLGPAEIGGAPVGPRAHAALTPLLNHAFTPAISIPLGETVDGLPLGLQIAGPRFADARVLDAASKIAALLFAR